MKSTPLTIAILVALSLCPASAAFAQTPPASEPPPDEPATALDAKTEAKIQQALGALTRGKTTFIIAHKFSTVAHADKILLLDQGRLAAYGTHRELLHTSHNYRELYELQVSQPLEYAKLETVQTLSVERLE